jgi:hypothetical protein
MYANATLAMHLSHRFTRGHLIDMIEAGPLVLRIKHHLALSSSSRLSPGEARGNRAFYRAALLGLSFTPLGLTGSCISAIQAVMSTLAII